MLKVINPINIDVAKAAEQLRKLDELLTELNFQYCICGGTLLGCIRHKSIMEWDDDLDILIHYSHMLILEKEFKQLGIETIREAHVGTYSKDFKFIVRMNIEGIFIDLWPAAYDNQNVLTAIGPYHPSEVFPLRRFKFYDFSVVVPQKPEAFLNRNFVSSAWTTWDGEEITWKDTIVKRLYGHQSNSFTLEEFKDELPEQEELPLEREK